MTFSISKTTFVSRFVKPFGLATFGALLFTAQPFTASTAHALCVVGVSYNDVLNMRSRPTSGSSIVGAIGPNRCGIRLDGRTGNWMYVRYRGQSGWVNSRFISDGDEGDGRPDTRCVRGVAGNDVLNVRRAPTTQSAIRGVLAPRACGVRVVGRSGNWVQISRGNVSGWVNSRFLTR